MFTNNKQIGLSTESRGVVNPTLDLIVPPVSAFLNKSFKKEVLINNREDDSFLCNKIYEVDKMSKYLDQKGNLTSEYYGYVYLIMDQKHNKVYVGQKKGLVEDSENYFGSGTIILRIQNKRGIYFLKKIILGVCYSKEELTICETECKHFFNAFDIKYGYNILESDYGGDTFTNNPDKERLREQHRQNALLGVTLKNKDRVFSDEYRKNLSDAIRGRESVFKDKTYEEIYGEERANEIRLKQSESQSNPEVVKKKVESLKKTLSEHPEILIEKGKKISKALKGKPSNKKDKTYEEIYGVDEALEQKNKRSAGNIGKHYERVGKTYEELYGEERAKEISEKISKANSGKPRKPMSQEQKDKLSKINTGRIPWNKGLTKEIDPRLAKSDECKEIISKKLTGNKNGLKNKKGDRK